MTAFAAGQIMCGSEGRVYVRIWGELHFVCPEELGLLFFVGGFLDLAAILLADLCSHRLIQRMIYPYHNPHTHQTFYDQRRLFLETDRKIFNSDRKLQLYLL